MKTKTEIKKQQLRKLMKRTNTGVNGDICW